MDTFWEEEFEALLHVLRTQGWQRGCASKSVMAQLAGMDAVNDVANALLSYWAQNPTLENYAVQINGASSLFLDPQDRRDVIARMNHEYVSMVGDTLPNDLAGCYAELQFWNGLNTPEVLEYFERLSDHFAGLVEEERQVGQEMAELLESSNLSPQMKQVRRHGVEAIRRQIKSRMNLLRSPQERMAALLDVAIDVGGPRIIDDELWAQAENWATQAADAGGKSYLALRDVLERAADGDIAERPREMLAHISRLLNGMDRRAQYGVDSEPEAALSYWRGKHFEQITDDALIRLYQVCLAGDPSLQKQFRKDFPLLRGRGREAEFQALLAQQPLLPEKERRQDGFAGRQEDQFRMDFSGKKWILGGLAILVLLLLLGITWMIRDRNRSEEEKKPAVSADVTPEEPQKTSQPTAKPQETEPATSATPKATLTPTPTATPSPEPTPEPTVEPTSEPTPEELPSSGPEDIDSEGLIEVLPDNETEEEIPLE